MQNFLALSGVYMIRCVATGEIYVGGTKTAFADRFKSHISALRSGQHRAKALQALYTLHGPEKIEFVPLQAFPPDEVHAREREAIRRLRPTLNPRTPTDSIFYQGRNVDITELAKLTGLGREMLYARVMRGLHGDDLIAPPHRTKRKEYTRKI